MAWKGLTLTLDGQSVLNNAQVSNRMNIKSIAIGDGDAPANFRNLKGLVNKLYEITDLKIEMQDGQCTITADFPQVNYDYTFREIGVIVTTDDGEKLYVYDNCGDDAQRIISSTGAETTKKRIRLFLEISDVADITVSTPSILYVAYDDFEENMDRIDASIDGKVDKETGKGLSTNDYTDQEKAKLQGIEEGANNYTHPATHPAAMIDQDAAHRYVSDLDKQEWSGAYAQATAYTDQQIADLINGAPSTLDTLGEIAQAMKDNEDVVGALDQAIGTKASQAEFDGHTRNNTIHITASERQSWNDKQTQTGDTQNNTISFTSGDATDPAVWGDVPVLSSGEKHSNILNKISTMFRNIRYLYKMLGTADISAIGDGTIKGALTSLNTSLVPISLPVTIYGSEYINGDPSVIVNYVSGMAFLVIHMPIKKEIPAWTGFPIAKVTARFNTTYSPAVTPANHASALVVTVSDDGGISVSTHDAVSTTGWYYTSFPARCFL